jgi:hypothetical protein
MTQVTVSREGMKVEGARRVTERQLARSPLLAQPGSLHGRAQLPSTSAAFKMWQEPVEGLAKAKYAEAKHARDLFEVRIHSRDGLPGARVCLDRRAFGPAACCGRSCFACNQFFRCCVDLAVVSAAFVRPATILAAATFVDTIDADLVLHPCVQPQLGRISPRRLNISSSFCGLYTDPTQSVR